MVRMLALLLSFPLFACSQQPELSHKVPTGFALNLSAVTDSATEQPFVDVFCTARQWVPQAQGKGWGEGPPLDLDDHGWLRSLDEGQYATAIMMTHERPRPGRYVCTWKGKGELRFRGKGESVTGAGGRHEIEILAGETILLDVLAVDRKDPLRDIRLVPVGTERKSAIFDEQFLDRCRKFRVLRFMDWMQTNDSEIRRWADRPKPDDAVQTRCGVALEHMIELCNETGASPWFCMPHLADDDFIRKFAAAVKKSLRRDSKVYVEYSNEVWNGQFAQARHAAEQGRAAALSDDVNVARLRYYSRRSVQIFRLWEQQFGGDGRLVRILAAQASSPWTSEQVLGFEDAYKYADALAIAPYFGNELGSPRTTGEVLAGGLDAIFRGCRDSIAANSATLEQQARIARTRGLPLIAYEGGQHLCGFQGAENNAELTALLQAANRDPRMRDLYLADQQTWRQAGGGLFAFYKSCGLSSKWGSWGLLEWTDQDSTTAPKYAAVLQLVAEFPNGW